MATFKKKDFKKLVKESDNIEEFVTDDGSVISGDEKYNKGVDVKTGPINMPDDEKGIAQDTDKFRSQAIQPRNWWWSLSYGYGQGSGKRPESVHGDNIHGEPLGETEELTESELAEERMRKMVEDILSKRSSNKDLVKKRATSDVNRDNVPDIEELSDTKMIIVGKLNDLIETMGASNLNGEEAGIVLNHLVSNLDTSKIPSDYKNIIKKQL